MSAISSSYPTISAAESNGIFTIRNGQSIFDFLPKEACAWQTWRLFDGGSNRIVPTDYVDTYESETLYDSMIKVSGYYPCCLIDYLDSRLAFEEETGFSFDNYPTTEEEVAAYNEMAYRFLQYKHEEDEKYGNSYTEYDMGGMLFVWGKAEIDDTFTRIEYEETEITDASPVSETIEEQEPASAPEITAAAATPMPQIEIMLTRHEVISDAVQDLLSRAGLLFSHNNTAQILNLLQ